MSDTDSFIDEVTEEVRRDRLFALYRRYGWIAVLAIVALVGAVAWSEYRQAQSMRAAQALGDQLIAAEQPNDPALRADALAAVQPDSPGGQAVAAFLTADAQLAAGDVDAAAATLDAVANTVDLPPVYRQMAAFKSLLAQTETLPLDDRRAGFEAMTEPGAPLRLLAEEQLALIDIEAGAPDAAIDRLQAMLQDAEANGEQLQRAVQVIIALGGTPDLAPNNEG
ncbi:MAG: tetratricopeptide repeat protein [Rhodobacteraceae bacterium]|nr:tetratricopeptide repeat protein [Paracoccaceae bacterium]